MKVLFIGGTGIISSACSRLALERGIELYLLNRGKSVRPVPEGARVLNGDIRSPDSARAALAVCVHQLRLGLPDPSRRPAGARVDRAG
jgi:nucleoside-diphosphate-sugar epimerase